MRSVTEWLRSRTDDELVTLLRHRPDLALPAPADLAVLATRLAVRSSVARATDALDAFTLRVLEAVALQPTPGSATVVADLVGGTGDEVRAAVDRLGDWGLVWRDEDRLHLIGTAREALGPHLAGLGQAAVDLWTTVPMLAARDTLTQLGLEAVRQPEAGLLIGETLADPDRVTELLRGLAQDERALLARIDAASPVVLLRPGQTIADEDSPAARLTRLGLLVPLDPSTVELPREVGIALRSAPPLAGVAATPPPIELAEPDVSMVDGTGVTQVLEITRQVAALIRDWTDEPPAILRAGGLGVRELRRTAKALDLTEDQTALLAEVGTAAGLIAMTSGVQPVWLPTTDVDSWLAMPAEAQWRRLAEAWRDMRRQPSLAGARSERGRLISVLSIDAERASAVATRRTVLELLSSLPAGARPRRAEEVVARLGWQAPRRAEGLRPAVEATLTEAEVLGITGGGALTTYGRHVMHGEGQQAQLALADALPAPVDEFLLQPDLTIVVPGPPSPPLAQALAATAELESSGGAQVWRITADSIRRAMDAGWSAADIDRLLTSRSRTPVPQALTYLIEDGARRHGVLRAGVVEGYLRCDDEALLDRVLNDRDVASLGLRRLSATVAVAAAPLDRVLSALRAGGYAPAAEDATGAAVVVAPDPPRSRVPNRRDRSVVTTRLGDETLTETVRRLRQGDELARTAHQITVTQSVPGVTSATTLGVLRDAIRSDRRVWVSYVEQAGTTATRIIAPLSLGGGFLRGHDADTQEFRSIPLHRLTSVNVLSD
ncbi:MAG: helicase-associated domain-containing protein [Jatrophihabitans sp.]